MRQRPAGWIGRRCGEKDQATVQWTVAPTNGCIALRANKRANTVFDSYAESHDQCTAAWNFFASGPAAITSITAREWAEVNLQGRWYDTTADSTGANLLDSRGNGDSLTGMGGNDPLLGGDGGDWLYGGANSDGLSGGIGSDQLSGGVGADEFWFATDDGTDKIHFSSAGESFAALTFASVTGGVRVTHDPGDYVTVLGVTLAQLTAADFRFG